MLHPFFNGLSKDNQALLAQVTKRVRVPAGQILFEQGDLADTALFIERGRVALSVRLPGGGTLALGETVSGDLLGELALVERHRRAATAHVIEPLEGLEMHRDDLRALCAVHHPASLAMLRRLARLVAGRLLTVDADRVPLRGPETRVVSRVNWREGADFDVPRFLPALPLFSTFTPSDIDALLGLGQVWSVGQDETILRYDDPPAACFVVIRGAVRSAVPTPQGPHRLAVFGPGTPFGALAALLQRPQSATCTVRERATLLELSSEALATLRNPAQHVSFRFQEALLRMLMHRLEQATRALTGERRLRQKSQ